MPSIDLTRRLFLALPLSSCRILTEDPGVAIVDWRPNRVTYEDREGRRWYIEGRCIACGECERGSGNPNLVWTGKPLGTAGACLDRTFDQRRDVPVRPDIAELPHCTLRGRYL